MKRGKLSVLLAFILVLAFAAVFVNAEGNSSSGNVNTSNNTTTHVEANNTITPNCTNDAVRKYTCSDGKEVDWCRCSQGLWTCANSPENSCTEATVTIAVNTTSCTNGEKKAYTCPNGSRVDWCECKENEWKCSPHPIYYCYPAAIAIEGADLHKGCPDGCICNSNTVACVSTAASGGAGGGSSVKACPEGCNCNNDTILCHVSDSAVKEKDCMMGCKLNSTCILPGIRAAVNETTKQYCDIDSTMKNQKKDNIECNNNYECETNLCIDSKCLSTGIWQKFLNWIKALFG